MKKQGDNPEILEAVARIDAPWLGRSDVVRLMDVLGDEALFVGGCVRNALLGAPDGDIDVATKLLPAAVRARCEAAGLQVVPTGIEHGTVTVVVDGVGFEVTTLRRDVATDGRRAVVAYADSWVEDARRRDFTMNTLLCDREGWVFDPLGCGFADLQARRVVFVGDPAQRIAEDVLRILRYFRFHGCYGEGAPDAAALAACAGQADKIVELSRERVTQEMTRIVMADRAAEVLRLMFDHGVLSAFSSMDLDVFARLCVLQAETGHCALFARLWAFYEQGCFEGYFCISNALRGDIESLSQLMDAPDFGSDQAVKVALYRYGRDVAMQGYLLWCAREGRGVEEEVLGLLESWDIPVFPVTGKDLLAQGYEPGPEIGRRLRELEERWIGSGFALLQLET